MLKLTAAISAAALLVVGALVGGPAARANASTISNVTVIGNGYGHGRGMGQYGAYGYARMGWNWIQIISHYYGGTNLIQLSAQQQAMTPIKVHLDEYDGSAPITVTGPNGSWTGRTPGWNSSGLGKPVTVSMSGGPTRTFKGTVSVQPNGDIWNTLSIDDYVAGVVPAESIPSWGTNGEAALQAQAVAARSYALSYQQANGYICDTPVCQVYHGEYTDSTYASYIDSAVGTTSGFVIECGQDSACGSSSTIARAEYSASTGGYTAGGAFPPVVDQGDGNPAASNPYHNWTVSVGASQIESAYRQIGTLQSVSITKRNGYGEWGGRVADLVISGSSGSVTVTGDDFAAALGLWSDWFTLSGPSGGDNGYWLVGSDGSISSFGSAANYGSPTGHLNAPVIGMAATPTGNGYWLVAGDGGIFTYGDARFYGSTGSMRLNKPVIGMAPTSSGSGYWLFASDGGIFTFGGAGFYGSTGSMHLNAPIVGMASTPDGGGYWLVASDGGIFTFGDAHFYGSTGSMRLSKPVVGMVPSSDGKGYFLVAGDGGIFTFGDARFSGSLPGDGITDNITGVAPTADGGGYLEVSSAGTVYPFGDAPYFGDVVTSDPGYQGHTLGVFAHAGT